MEGTIRDKKDVMEAIKANNVKFVMLWFTDVLGQLKSLELLVDELEVAFEEGMGFDGSSIEGFARIEESDMLAFPDPSTFAILPWEYKGYKIARMFADIYLPDLTPYSGDSRYILKQNLKKAKEIGYTFYVGPELEFFIFKNNKQPEFLDEGGYFDYSLDIAENFRKEIILALEAMNIKVEYSHHEVAPSQHEIDLRYTEALQMADIVVTVKAIIKEIAKRNGIYATFMPKPVYGINGSGMHIHQSLFIGEQNAFFDPKDPFRISQTAKHYIEGLLRHIKEITIILNQWVNSYKRLVPGYEAPVNICWGHKNRSSLIRVPMYKPGKEKAVRIELRSPDPACNPYLAFACMLGAGLEGIKKQYPLREPIEKDVYLLSDEEKKALNIEYLPGSLIEAIEIAKKSDLLKKILGEKIFNFIIQNKKLEWDMYRVKITSFELERYLPIL
ncbi:MAG: Glutamine synthetase [Thermodesulfobacteria bacterium]|mgnify:FL=1|nr:glutamine synthetase family protein [Thermodesulfobacteriota bacterium]MCU4138318.1 Glutamine synthetase [Thermodesulfobacteriota bacterium]